MQLSTFILSAAAFIPSILACMDVNVTYTRGSAPNLFISYMDNGRLTCYYNQSIEAISNTELYTLDSSNKDIVNDTNQHCVSSYWTSIQLDLADIKDHPKNNVIKYYRYFHEQDFEEFEDIKLGPKITTAATRDSPEVWTWLAHLWCK